MDAEIERLTGITRERALRVDEVSLYDRLGEDVFRRLSTEFYTRVFNDEEKWFRNIFKGREIDEAIQNQMDFFIQRLGGPPRFSARKGPPALIARHLNFNMTEKAAKRWLFHMAAAMDTTEGVDTDSKERMLDFFTHTAHFLSIGVSSRKPG